MGLHEFIHTIKHAIMITSFVLMMMLLIEFINVLTKGIFQSWFNKNKWQQYLIVVLLGLLPGCLGTFTVVSLFTHKIVSFGALVANMIATSGDETYVMLSLFPLETLYLSLLLGIVAFATAFVVDRIVKNQENLFAVEDHGLEIHSNETQKPFCVKDILNNYKNLTFHRALLLFIGISFITLIATRKIAADADLWIVWTFLIGSVLSLFIISIVSDHFLEDHLWKHVIKKHLLRIFLWTFGALFVTHLLNTYFDFSSWVQQNMWIMLLLAVAIGIIPESGPHLIFVTLFSQGIIPFSILFASSAVQDGHGSLPLLAVSRKAWILMRIFNIFTGLLIGGIMLVFGF